MSGARQQNAVVTGGSSGIGQAIVHRLLADGYRVITTGRDISRLTAAFSSSSSSTGLSFVIADLATMDGPSICATEILKVLSTTTDETATIDVLIHNAGGGSIGQHIATGATTALFDEVFNLNVRTPFFLTQLLSSSLTSPGAVIINLSSVAAQRPFSGMGPYCMSKAAVDMFTQVAALEFAPRQIRVVGIAPGTIGTHFHENAGMSSETAAAYYEASTKTHPIGRVGTANDVSEMVAFLIDNSKASFITGSTMVVDGGRLLTASTAPQLGSSSSSNSSSTRSSTSSSTSSSTPSTTK